MIKPVLAGLLYAEVAELLKKYPLFRSRQIYKWIISGAGSFDDMSNLPLPLREELKENYILFPGRVVSEKIDTDATVKLGISLEDGVLIETVILSDGEGRKTACLSTQAGCPMACAFCKTGMLGFRRNLSAPEITGQFLHLKTMETGISHIVFMGMGEPLLNLIEVRKALDFIMDPGGINISKRRITLSTCGIVSGIHDLAGEGPDIRLALSLITARQELRDKLMPISRDNPLPSIKEALIVYQSKRKRRITLEMVLLGNINTDLAEADAVADFARGLDTVINLIPWNPVRGLVFEGSQLKPPAPREIADFAAALENRGLKVTQRMGKGCGISGACGQLGVINDIN